MREELDNDLLKLFEEEKPELPEEPFRAELRLRIEKARVGYSRMYWLLTALALTACAAVTSFIVDGVMLFCGEMSRVLQSTGEFLVIPAGWEFLITLAGWEFFTIPAGWVVVTAVTLLSLLFSRRALSMIT